MNELPKDQALWNAVFAIAFIGIAVVLFWGLTDGLRHYHWLYFLNAFDIAIISLATFRIIRLVSYDKIFAFVRNWFVVRQPDGSYAKQGGGPRRTIAELLECLWCTGLWATLLVTTLYFGADIGRFIVIILAVAAIGSFLQNFSQLVSRLGTHHHGQQ